MRRRPWLLGALGAGGALLVGWVAMPPRGRVGGAGALPVRDGTVVLNGWLRVADDGRVSLVMARSEMGQGVHTALAMVVAEELELPLTAVQLEAVGSDSRYGNVSASVESVLSFGPDDSEPAAESATVRASRWLLGKVIRELGINATGGSSSIADLMPVLQRAAATARAQLLGAASLQWRLPVAELMLADGVVSHPSGPRAHFGELARHAAATPPGRVVVKPRDRWRLLGTSPPRTDLPAKVDGSARFGIDVRQPGQLYAAIVHGEVLGASPGAVDVDSALRLPGVLRVVRLPPRAGSAPALAVVGRTSWHALQGALRLQADWRQPPHPVAGSDVIARSLAAAADRAAGGRHGSVFRDDGDALAALAQPEGRVVEARYAVPYLAHATMEPMNCTAQVTDGRVRLWAPTQVPTFARGIAAEVAGVDEDAVELEVTYLGGGFGRRLEVDFVAQAVRVAVETGGAPVQLLWPREQDFGHDFYRPAAAAVMRGVLTADGTLLALAVGSAGDAVMPRYYERVLPAFAPPVDLPDKTSAEGLFSWPYRAAHVRVAHEATHHGVPVGSWRSVGHSQNAFFAESFADELAHAAGVDPLAWRLAQLAGRPRHAAVLRLAAERAGWGSPLQRGRARGVALHESFGTIVAEVVEVEGGTASAPRVLRVVVAADCGTVVHPGIVAQQLESAVVFGLTAALHGGITIDGGAVRERRFSQQRLLTLAETPRIETHLIASTRPPGGVGEPGTPPAAPALANALFALDHVRRRTLPLRPAT